MHIQRLRLYVVAGRKLIKTTVSMVALWVSRLMRWKFQPLAVANVTMNSIAKPRIRVVHQLQGQPRLARRTGIARLSSWKVARESLVGKLFTYHSCSPVKMGVWKVKMRTGRNNDLCARAFRLEISYLRCSPGGSSDAVHKVARICPLRQKEA